MIVQNPDLIQQQGVRATEIETGYQETSRRNQIHQAKVSHSDKHGPQMYSNSNNNKGSQLLKAFTFSSQIATVKAKGYPHLLLSLLRRATIGLNGLVKLANGHKRMAISDPGLSKDRVHEYTF